MAVRGAEAKNIVTAKILDAFVGAFVNNKEIRIPVEENGEIIQIKCVLTASKTNVKPNEGTAVPTATPTPATTEQATLTEQERKDVANILAELNL
jgi:hypothetical protein